MLLQPIRQRLLLSCLCTCAHSNRKKKTSVSKSYMSKYSLGEREILKALPKLQNRNR